MYVCPLLPETISFAPILALLCQLADLTTKHEAGARVNNQALAS